MLRLKQIDLYGFKSFCNRERLRFAGSGIAAAVGPNGCGKSNICDAVNWVLGEQSAKSLRGARMNDVIFNGTKRRPAAGLATVTLKLHDPDGTLEKLFGGEGRKGSITVPAASKAGEITVTRKLFSSGQSQYILNGKVVRLRDVRNLFLGTGLGPNHYAIIEQGRIGQLLSARPPERRAFVEEAAGITRFKERRRLAELKLANASLNLERVHDILQEVRRQAGSLKRQAKRAERHERYRRQLRSAVRLVFGSRFVRIETARESLEKLLATQREKLDKETAGSKQLEADFDSKREREQVWDRKLLEARNGVSGLRVKKARMRERIKQQERTIHSNVQLSEQRRQDQVRAAERIRDISAGVEAKREKVAALKEETEGLRERLRLKVVECGKVSASVTEADQLHATCRKHVLENLDQKYEAKTQLGKLDEAIANHSSRIQRARSRRDDALKRLAGIASISAQLEAQSRGLRLEVKTSTRERDGLQRDVAKSTAQLDESKRAAGELRATVSSLEARRDSVQGVLDHHEYSTDSVKGIFDDGNRSRRLGFRPPGVLADFLEVDGGYEKAVEQFLGDDLEQVVVDDWSQAGQGVGLVKEVVGGRASFIVRFRIESADRRLVECDETAVPLADKVRFVLPDGGTAPELPPKLRHGYAVESSDAAVGLARANPESYFLLPDGTWYHGNTVSTGRKKSSGPLVLKRQLRQIGPELERTRAALLAMEEQIGEDGAAFRQLEADLEKSRERLQDLEKQAVAADQALSQHRSSRAELERARDEAAEDIKRQEAARRRSKLRRSATLATLAAVEARQSELEADSNRLSHEALTVRQSLAVVEEERGALRTESATLEERLRAREESLTQSERLLSDQQRRRNESALQIDRWTQECEVLSRDNERLRQRVQELEEQGRELQSKIGETETALEDSRKGTTALIEDLRKQRDRVDTVRSEFNKKEIERARLVSDRDHLAEECQSELGEPIESVVAEMRSDLTDEERAEAERVCKQVREKIDRLGPVNVLALEEYREVSQRRDFLEFQENDLIEAIANTRQSIATIDSASRERFDATFRAINANFRQVFATLFDGGLGEMRLTDSSRPTESGIDFVAQPPGKRLQSVALLSGGEKSLTVMALLLATFRHKPSPFCILDEVDSQLDEANTVRLKRVLQEMAPETQFLLITHSKTMMEAAETLFGITMGEAGVSKVVSVRMTEHRALAERPSVAEQRTVAVVR